MKKLVISLVIEGDENDLHTIKGNILATACESLVSCTVSEYPEPKKEIKTDMFFKRIENADPYEVGVI